MFSPFGDRDTEEIYGMQDNYNSAT